MIFEITNLVYGDRTFLWRDEKNVQGDPGKIYAECFGKRLSLFAPRVFRASDKVALKSGN